MARWIAFLIVLCILVVGVVWFVQNPGDVTLEWRGWRIDTSVGVMMMAMALLAVVAGATYRFWRFLRRAPGEVGAAMHRRKQRKGYAALSSGMVAVAAGDAGEARRQARRAEALLVGDTPLTRLLSAQSAQLDGDEKAAETFFTEMLDDPDTRFLGLRGLLTQAMKAGDRNTALELATKCHAMQPKSAWVNDTLFELQTTGDRWIEAAETAEGMLHRGLIDKPDADRRRAVIAFERARDLSGSAADRRESLKLLKKAVDLAPDLIPAAVALIDRHLSDGHHRKAAALAEKTWARLPHPDLVQPYWDAKRVTDPLARVKTTEKLAALSGDHIEGHLALARAALDASLWGEARKHLTDAGAGDGLEPPVRVCRLMAELEEREHDDLQKAREWLVRAGTAPADPAWVCGNCGNTVGEWTPRCGNCETFDGYAWDVPRHVTSLPATSTAKTPDASDGAPATLPVPVAAKDDTLPTVPTTATTTVTPSTAS